MAKFLASLGMVRNIFVRGFDAGEVRLLGLIVE